MIVDFGQIKTQRPAGQVTTPEERAKWPLDKVMAQLKLSVRVDYGGARDTAGKRRVVLARMAEFLGQHPDAEEILPVLRSMTERGQAVLADVLMNNSDHTRKGISTRINNHIKELERRLVRQDGVSQ